MMTNMQVVIGEPASTEVSPGTFVSTERLNPSEAIVLKASALSQSTVDDLVYSWEAGYMLWSI